MAPEHAPLSPDVSVSTDVSVSASASPALAYTFAPSPNPIRASEAGASANAIDLQVIVSNPSLHTVSVGRVTIEIPVGEETSRALSVAPHLPPPTYDASGPWTIRAEGGVVTIAPKSGDAGSVRPRSSSRFGASQ